VHNEVHGDDLVQATGLRDGSREAVEDEGGIGGDGGGLRREGVVWEPALGLEFGGDQVEHH